MQALYVLGWGGRRNCRFLPFVASALTLAPLQGPVWPWLSLACLGLPSVKELALAQPDCGRTPAQRAAQPARALAGISKSGQVCGSQGVVPGTAAI